MRNRTLGTIGMLGAPFLCIDLLFHTTKIEGLAYTHTSLGGFFSLIYITAWMCSIIGLRQLYATGTRQFGRSLLVFLLFTLTLANGWNVYEMIDPQANTPLYRMLDIFWPISNLVMFMVGIAAVVAGQLTGWKRYIPLLVGLWLPFSALLFLSFGRTVMVLYVSGIYSAITWIILGYVIRTTEQLKFRPVLPTNPAPAGTLSKVTEEATFTKSN